MKLAASNYLHCFLLLMVNIEFNVLV